jgi:hypothetical protein
MKIFIDMKSLIKKLLREHVINERLTNVDSDVDLLYDKYFRDDIEIINNTGFIDKKMFKKFEIDTSILTSPESIKCHKLNPCVIKINIGRNFYDPNNAIIGIGYHSGAYDFIMGNADGDIKIASEYLDDERQKNSLTKEFTEERIKGTIHHELAHWVDDTLNNRHLNKMINKAIKLGTKDFNGVPVNATKIEIQGQIHNIKQLYKKYSNIWDSLTFDEMLSMIPSTSYIYSKFSNDVKKRWRKDIKLRMHREGLLGKNMVN